MLLLRDLDELTLVVMLENTAKMDILEKIKYNHQNKIYSKVYRKVGKGNTVRSNGYIVDYSESYILLQETFDFEIGGYLVIPINTISKIVLNANDKYYHKIMQLEGLTDKIINKHKLDLTSWESIFKSIRKLNLNVIIENENPDDSSFDIGIIEKITKNSVYLRYFDAKGYLSIEPTKIVWNLITIAQFDDKYTNTFSKYLRNRKPKKRV